MRILVSAMLVLVGIIHVLPLAGVMGGDRLARLYGVAIDDPNLEILLRHRAVLFFILGAFLIYAAFRPGLQWIALVAAFISVVSFLWLAWTVGGYNAQLARVFKADLIALVGLLIAAAAYSRVQTGGAP